MDEDGLRLALLVNSKGYTCTVINAPVHINVSKELWHSAVLDSVNYPGGPRVMAGTISFGIEGKGRGVVTYRKIADDNGYYSCIRIV